MEQQQTETRQLAKLVIVDDVVEHSNADALELVIIGGWQCCVKKGEFKKGDMGVYFEIDSMLPLDIPAFEFLQGRNEREFEGKRYSRIKTIKLRKELSQGLLLPIESINWKELPSSQGHCLVSFRDSEIGSGLTSPEEFCTLVTQLTQILGVVKYEPALPACLSGNAKGLFPSFLRKSDQERIQNLKREHEKSIGEEFEVTFKLDGSSFTAFVFRDGGEEQNIYTGLCSRNLELKVDESNAENTFVQTFNNYDLDSRLREYYNETGNFIAIQGEMVGPGIQNNFEGLQEVQLFVYNVFDIREQKYLLPDDARKVVEELGLNYVPVFKAVHQLTESIPQLLEMAEGPSGLNGKYREGLVFKSLTRNFSFKVISSTYCLAER